MRKLSWSCLAVTLVLLLVAPGVFAKVTVRVYHRNETREIEWVKQIEKDFEVANPDIDIELVEGIGGGGVQYAERLAVLWAAGDAPDVFYGAADKAGFILNGWTLDVTSYLQRDKQEIQLQDFFPSVFENSTRNGRNMGVPAVAMGQALFYNKQLFSEAGVAYPPADWNSPQWTWDDFLAAGKKLTKVGPDGRSIQAALSSVRQYDFLWQNGGDLYPAEAWKTGIADRVTLANEPGIEAFTKLQDLYLNTGYMADGPKSAVGKSDFVKGTVAMEWSGWYKTRDYVVTQQSGGMKWEWGMAPVPKVLNRANQRVSDPWFISSITKHPEEAWRFVKYVTSRQGQTNFSQYVVFPPSRQSALGPYVEAVTSMSGMKKAEFMTAISSGLNSSRVAPDEIIGGYRQVDTVIAPILTSILKGQKAVRPGLEEAERAASAVLKEMAARWKK